MNSALVAAVRVRLRRGGCLLLAIIMLSGCTQAGEPRAAGSPAPRRPSLPGAHPPARAETAARLEVTVKRVVDGDTLLVSGLPKGTGLVRLTGIDAPETGDGRTTRECFGPEARRWLADQAPPGTPITLVLDVGERDRFGRLLAYAYRADGMFLNADLVANGYAQTMTIRPNVRHGKELQELQRRARAQKVGLWGACREWERPR